MGLIGTKRVQAHIHVLCLSCRCAMEATASVHQALRKAKPHHTAEVLFRHPRYVRWLFELETWVLLQMHKHYRNRRRSSFWIHPGMHAAHGSRMWRPVRNVKDVSLHSWLATVHDPTTRMRVVALRRTRFQLDMAVLYDPQHRTLVITFTGLQSYDLVIGARVTCYHGTSRFADVLRSHRNHHSNKPLECRVVPPHARVHTGMADVWRFFSTSDSWAVAMELLHDATQVDHVIISGFSLGGAMCHFATAFAAEAMATMQRTGRTPPTLTAVAQGAPRTGDAVWAGFFGQQKYFAHVNLVAADTVVPTSETTAPSEAGARGRSRDALHIDEVATMPHASTFVNCVPVVVVRDGTSAFNTDALQHLTTFHVRKPWQLCVASMNFIRGFSMQHRQVLH